MSVDATRVRADFPEAASTGEKGPQAAPLLEVRNLSTTVRGQAGSRRSPVTIVDDVSFTLDAGQTLGIVGESGCGKSTLANSVMQLQRASTGSVLFDGVELTRLRRAGLKSARRHLQMVFQDPHSSLDPRMTVREIVREPLRNYRIVPPAGEDERVRSLVQSVGLPLEVLDRKPRQMSGGQAQRVAIARALASDPKLLVLDEAVSSLDISVRAQVLNLLVRLSEERGLSYLFIAHDLAAVAYVSDLIAVMYLGRICEIGPTSAVLGSGGHPYTSVLMSSDPREIVHGAAEVDAPSGDEVPSVFSRSSGCAFAGRCPEATDLCRREAPALERLDGEHWVACHFRTPRVPIARSTKEKEPTDEANH